MGFQVSQKNLYVEMQFQYNHGTLAVASIQCLVYQQSALSLTSGDWIQFENLSVIMSSKMSMSLPKLGLEAIATK